MVPGILHTADSGLAKEGAIVTDSQAAWHAFMQELVATYSHRILSVSPSASWRVHIVYRHLDIPLTVVMNAFMWLPKV